MPEEAAPIWPPVDPEPQPIAAAMPTTTGELSSSTPVVTGGDGGSRASQAMEVWRRRLLDLSRRNRALNFRANKVSTVVIVDEQPAEVFLRLCIDTKPMRFQPTLRTPVKGEAPLSELAEPKLDGIWDDASSDEVVALEEEFTPYEGEALEERHRDDVLQAQSTPDALDKSLRRLSEMAHGSIEEAGVNILFLALGMLHYTDSKDSEVVSKAPLVMVPVRLVRKSARSGFLVEATEEEPIINPALAEMLRRQFGFAFPELPSPDGSEAASAVRGLFEEVHRLVSRQVAQGLTGWKVTTDIFLSTFAFQKLVMFKDLEANAASFVSHSLIRKLVTREAPAGSYVSGLPREIGEAKLDEMFPPEGSAQVVDADSSQLRSILAVSRGHSLVIEGPPGTGKSQTITNLIAQAISEGKSVLFVAEKMAALQVVHSRLVRAGLGEFCLELHASKANKRAVLHEIRAALDASLQRPMVPARTHRLPRVRTELTAYSRAAHEPYGSLGISPFRATGLLDRLSDAPRVRFQANLGEISSEALDDAAHSLDELAEACVGLSSSPASHPWSGSRGTLFTPSQLGDIDDLLRKSLGALDELGGENQRVTLALNVPAGSTSAEILRVTEFASLLSASPGASEDVLLDPLWNSAPAQAVALIGDLEKLQKERARLLGLFSEECLEADLTDDIEYVVRKSSGFFGFLAILDGRFRSIRRRWISYRRSSYSAPLLDQSNDLKAAVRYQISRNALESAHSVGTALFGAVWNGQFTDLKTLNDYVDWVVRMRGAIVTAGLTREAIAPASVPRPAVVDTQSLLRLAEKVREILARLEVACAFAPQSLVGLAYADAHTRVSRILDSIDEAPNWAAFETARVKATEPASAELVARWLTGDDGIDKNPALLSRTMRRAALESLLESVVAERSELREFSTSSHEKRLTEFRQLDQWILEDNRASLVSKLREAAQTRLQQPEVRACFPILQQQMSRQRNIMPLRKLMQHTEPAIRALKPCLLMSPLTVAQLLDGKAPRFDLVIFDEASQLPTEDAVGAVARARQLVVVGDPKQLPPTSFFVSAATHDDSPVDEDGLPIVQDSESVLEEFMGAGVPITRLRWHYRSAHESLIAFSNASFYDSDLFVFPSVDTDSSRLGLSFEHVSNGVYEGKGVNSAEARRVADAVVEHIKTRPSETLGVGTFNIRQQLAILDELELRRRQDPSIEPFFARGEGENFFVKNLENIQGDERDVIFLSVTYGKGLDGRLRMNFGALNSENGWGTCSTFVDTLGLRRRAFEVNR